MNRKKSISLLVVGVVMTFATMLGVFAAQTDSASTGDLQVTSGALATSIDLEIADQSISNDATDCSTLPTATYVDNQTIQPLVFNNAESGDPTFTRYVCVRNTGVENAQMNIDVFGITNTETGCTGDESTFDLTTCGTGAGELGPLLEWKLDRIGAPGTSGVTCDKVAALGGATYNGGVVADSGNPVPDIGAGETACYRIEVTYPGSGLGGTSPEEAQEAQSDQVTWKVRFNGNA